MKTENDKTYTILSTITNQDKEKYDKDLLENYYIMSLLKECENLKKNNKWQPIETAPKDGTEILVNLRHNVAMYIVFFDNEKWVTQSGHKWDTYQVTHWQPLPETPESEEV